MFASTCLAEKGVEGIVPTTDGLVTGHLAIRLDPVLQTVQLPTGIAHLDTGLANMDADTFALKEKISFNMSYMCTYALESCNKHLYSNSKKFHQIFSSPLNAYK